MKIELFTEVNFRGPTAKNGKCIALVECETKKGQGSESTDRDRTEHDLPQNEHDRYPCRSERCSDRVK